MTQRFRHGALALPVLLVGLVSILLVGCVDELPDVNVAKGDVRNAIAKGQLKSPRNSSVAIASLEGAPDAITARFTQMFGKEAADREIALRDAAAARYLVRGYLSAIPTEKGTEIAYVYDIFDATDHRRLDRVSDALTVPGSATDAWARVDDRVVASLASRSADGLAMALSGTPEAQGDTVAATAPLATAGR